MMLTMPVIAHVVGVHFGVGLHLIIGPLRTPLVARARKVAMYLCRRCLLQSAPVGPVQQPLSYPNIGAWFNRDHTTVMSAVRDVQRRLEKGDDDQINQNVIAAIMKRLRPMMDAHEMAYTDGVLSKQEDRPNA